MCVGMLRYELRVSDVMPWTRKFDLTGQGGCLWVGKRVYMTVEVYMDCVCRFLGVYGLKRECI